MSNEIPDNQPVVTKVYSPAERMRVYNRIRELKAQAYDVSGIAIQMAKEGYKNPRGQPITKSGVYGYLNTIERRLSLVREEKTRMRKKRVNSRNYVADILKYFNEHEEKDKYTSPSEISRSLSAGYRYVTTALKKLVEAGTLTEREGRFRLTAGFPPLAKGLGSEKKPPTLGKVLEEAYQGGSEGFRAVMGIAGISDSLKLKMLNILMEEKSL